MTSFESAATTSSHFHLPQHIQPLHPHHPQDARRVLEEIVTSSNSSCSRPSPQVKSYFNPLTNRTSYVLMKVRVYEIGILYNYEIRHKSGISWENEEEGEEDGGGGILDKAGNFFNDLFGGGDDEDKEPGSDEGDDSSKAGNFFNHFFDGGDDEDKEPGSDEGDVSSQINNCRSEDLIQVEKEMVSKIWKTLLKDERMTWGNNSLQYTQECAGLLTTENEQGGGGDAKRTRRRQLLWKQQQEERSSGGQIRNMEGMVDGLRAEETAATNATMEGDILDTEETLDTVETTVNYSTFSGTKLLGLTYLPLDSVNHQGCLVPDTTCTSINGQLSAAYSGLDEYSVIQTVIAQLLLLDDSFLLPDSPALNLEFISSGGTVPVGGGASSYRLNTARGTALDDQPEEESYLSKYGVSFVCLVAILGVATVISTFVRYRKRQKRIAMANGEEGVEWSEEDYESNLAMQQVEEGGEDGERKTEEERDSRSDTESPMSAMQRVEKGVEDGERKTEEEGDSRSDTESPISAGAWLPATGAVEPVELMDAPAVNSKDEVEISLADSKGFNF